MKIRPLTALGLALVLLPAGAQEGPQGPCGEVSTQALLHRKDADSYRFRVTATYDVPARPAGVLLATWYIQTPEQIGATDSVVFFFNNWRKAELVISAVNGCPVDGRLWFFVSSQTSRPWTLTLWECDADFGPCGAKASHTFIGSGRPEAYFTTLEDTFPCEN